MNLTMKTAFLTACLTGTALAFESSAAIVVINQFDMGEAGSLSSGRPVDSVGAASFVNSNAGGFGSSTASPSPVSGAYATDSGVPQGAFTADFTAMPTDNFGVELWVRTADANQVGGEILAMNGHAGSSLKFGIGGGNWLSSYHNVSWIGAAGGAGQGVVANKWTHLAAIRDNGTTTLYIDGVAQASTTATAPGWGTLAHIGVSPGGSAGFVGDIDAIRTFSFEQGDDPVAFLNIPEPSSLALLGLGGLLMLRRSSAQVARRRRG